MTAQEIIDVLMERLVNYDLIHDLFAYCVEEYIEGIGICRHIESWGGEDEGSQIGAVAFFPDHNVYLRIDGYYQSHYGSDWEYPPYEVLPQEKTIITYVKKGE